MKYFAKQVYTDKLLICLIVFIIIAIIVIIVLSILGKVPGIEIDSIQWKNEKNDYINWSILFNI